RYLTYAQLLAVPVGAATVAYVYPVLRNTYGIGGDNGLPSPVSQRVAGFARLLSGGLSAPPHGAGAGVWGGGLAGGGLTSLENTKLRKWLPSPTGIGIGMLVPSSAVCTMFVGGVLAEIWKLFSREQAERNLTPVASGFIAGEALVAVLIPILFTLHIIK